MRWFLRRIAITANPRRRAARGLPAGIPADQLGEEERVSANVPVTAAFFERLKFQAALSGPPGEFIAREDIALGLLPFRGQPLRGFLGKRLEPGNRRLCPRSMETRGYVFGLRRAYDGKRRVASEQGVLSGEGTAALTQKTGDGSDIKGAPYRYSVEAQVTDLSNQMAAAYRSVLVHPARFYLGLARSGGFARTGEEIAFNFITVNPAGERPRPASFCRAAGKRG
jgi:hypothetical protein